MNADALEKSILDFLHNELRIRDQTIGRDTELVSTGLIDSTDLVRVAAHLERTLEIEIPDEDISPDYFDSVAMILAYVERKLGS